jgi:hypothetical protein
MGKDFTKAWQKGKVRRDQNGSQANQKEQIDKKDSHCMNIALKTLYRLLHKITARAETCSRRWTNTDMMLASGIVKITLPSLKMNGASPI